MAEKVSPVPDGPLAKLPSADGELREAAIQALGYGGGGGVRSLLPSTLRSLLATVTRLLASTAPHHHELKSDRVPSQLPYWVTKSH